MYNDHCRDLIAPACQHDPAILRRAALFTVLSIRQSITIVPKAMDDVAKIGGASRFLFGHKREAFMWLSEESNLRWLWLQFGAAREAKNPFAALMAALAVPGLGIVKGAFLCQLAGFNVACLDSRNVKRLELDARRWRTDGRPPDKLAAKARAYVAETFGQARDFWDDWCEDAAEYYGTTAQEISALHLAILPQGPARAH